MTAPDGYTGLDVVLDGDNAWPDLMDKPVLSAPLAGIAALPGATANGRTVIALRINLPDGTVIIAETTHALLAAANRAIVARHGDPNR